MKKIKNYSYIVLPVIGLLLWSFLLGDYLKGDLLVVHDSAWIGSKSLSSYFLSAWNFNNFGHNQYVLIVMGFFPRLVSSILWLFINNNNSFYVLYYFIITSVTYILSFFGFKFLLKSIYTEEKPFAAFLAAIFYCFNVFMTTTLHGGVFDALFVNIISLPYLLGLIHSIIKNPSSKYNYIYLGLLSGFNINTGPFFVAVLLCLLPVFIGWQILYKRAVVIKYLVLSVLSALSSGGLFIYLTYLTLFQGDAAKTAESLKNYIFSSLGFFGRLNLFFDWTFNLRFQSANAAFHPYSDYFNNPYVVTSTMLLWLLLFVLTSFYQKVTVKKMIVVPLMFILVSMFISKGIQYPFPMVNKFLYDFKLFGIFRTPDIKFGITMAFAIAFTIALVVIELNKPIIRLVLILIVAISINRFFVFNTLVEESVPPFKFARDIRIPMNFNSIVSNIAKNNDNGYVFVIPGISYGSYLFDRNVGHIGPDILPLLVQNPLIYNDHLTSTKGKGIYDSVYSDLANLDFAQYNIGHILLYKRVNNEVYDDYLVTLNSNKNLELLFNDDYLALFKSKNRLLGLVTVNGEPVFIPFEDLQSNFIKLTLPVINGNVRIDLNTLNSSDWKLFTFNEGLINKVRDENSWIFLNSGSHTVYIFNQKTMILRIVLFSSIVLTLILLFYSRISGKKKQDIKLDFVGIGVTKAGTTWLTSCLQAHPEIFIPSRKELMYFVEKSNGGNYWKGKAWLQKQFSKRKYERIIGEFTTQYVLFSESANLIKENNKEIKVLVCLRNPVDMLYSFYWWKRANFEAPDFQENFDTLVFKNEDFIRRGMYYEQLKRFFSTFSRKDIHIVLYDDIKSNPKLVLKNLYSFLGVNPNFDSPKTSQRVNASKEYKSLFLAKVVNKMLNLLIFLRLQSFTYELISSTFLSRIYTLLNKRDAKYPEMSKKTRSKLSKIFKEDIKKLSVLIERDLSEWI